MKRVFKKLVKNRWSGVNDTDASNNEGKSNGNLSKEDLYQINCAGGYHIDSDSEINSISKLHYEAWTGNLENLKKNLTNSHINAVDSHNRTALHLAVVQNHQDIVQLLLEKNADVNIADSDGLTPFLKAVEIGNMELVRIFLEHNIDLFATDSKGNTALHLAVLYGFRNIVAFLLHKGAARDVVNKNGDTPLHIATQNEYLEVVDLLLKNGVSFDITDSEHRTPLMLANKIKNTPLLKLFEHHGASDKLSNSSTEDSKEEGHHTQALSDLKETAEISIVTNIADQLHNEKIASAIITDEDSQISLPSCCTPPALKPPRSWDILQSGLIKKQDSESEDRTLGIMKSSDEIWNRNEVIVDESISANSKQLPPADVKLDKNQRSASNGIPPSLKSSIQKTTQISTNRNERHTRCKSLVTLRNINSEEKTFDENKKTVNRKSAQLEVFDRFLQDLSLSSSSAPAFSGGFRDDFSAKKDSEVSLGSQITGTERKIKKHEENKSGRKDTVKTTRELEAKSYESKNDTVLGNKSEVRTGSYNIHDEERPELRNNKKRNVSGKRHKLLDIRDSPSNSPVDNDSESDDSSSDEDPPFWRNSSKGGFFARQSTVVKVSDQNKEITQDDDDPSSDSSLSSKDLQYTRKVSFSLEAPHNIIWDHLKQVTKEKGELENASESLKETAEKLKYDLANSRQALAVREDSLASVTKQLVLLDEKYLKTMEQMTNFQQCIRNLEQEVAFLTDICQKANKNNQYLTQQINYLVENNRQTDEEKQKLLNQNICDIQKLQSDVLYWQQKHDIIAQKLEEEHSRKVDIQDVDSGVATKNQTDDDISHSEIVSNTIQSALDKLNSKLDECLPKECKTRTETEVCDSKNEAINCEDKCLRTLAEVKNVLQQKFDELRKHEEEKIKLEARMMADFEHAKKKYSLEVSRLTSLLKLKGEEVEKLKSQYDELTNQIEQCKDDRRRKLIQKSYNLSLGSSENHLENSDVVTTPPRTPPPSPTIAFKDM